MGLATSNFFPPLLLLVCTGQLVCIFVVCYFNNYKEPQNNSPTYQCKPAVIDHLENGSYKISEALNWSYLVQWQLPILVLLSDHTLLSMLFGIGGVLNSTTVCNISCVTLCRWRMGSAMTVLALATLADSKGRVVGKGRGDNNCCWVFSCCNS